MGTEEAGGGRCGHGCYPVEVRPVEGRTKRPLPGVRAYGRRARRLRNGSGPMAESQLSELRNMRVMLEQARLLARDLAYHRRARLEAAIGRALDEVDGQIEELRAGRRG